MTAYALAPNAMPSAFLSYARSDDEPFVERLRDDLIARGIDVWWDRKSMESRGRTFHQEILDAISRCDRFVLIVGPNAIASPYVRQEWEQALACDKVVTPILRRGDFPLVPDEIRLLHCEDFRDDRKYLFALGNLTRQLSSAPPPLGKLIAVPSLPPHFLRREDRLRTLRDSLRADLDGPVVIGAVASRVGVHGMGGIGKSVLAAAVARDRKVREAFPDGIYWIPLGTEPNVVERMRELHRALGGDGDFGTAHDGKVSLQETLREKHALLILDDVWRRPDADEFDVLGPRCRMLVTTRDSGLLTSLGGVHHVLDLMTDEESLDLLAATSGVSRSELPDIAEAVVAECGRLPLAVSLCGSLVRRGKTWIDVLTQLQQARLDRISDRHAVQEHHRSVWHAIHVSVASLETLDRERFLELAVFPPDESIPIEAAATLWSLDSAMDLWSADELVATLAERSLLQRSDASGRAAVGGRSISLHDIVFDYVRAEHADFQALHDRLLAAYAELCPYGWASGPNDGYFFEHLVYHMKAAGRPDKALRLLTDFDWLHAKTSAGLAADIVRELRDTEATSPAESIGPLKPWSEFIRSNASFLARHPNLFFQAAYNEPSRSPVSIEAVNRWNRRNSPSSLRSDLPERFLAWSSRPQRREQEALLLTLIGHTDFVIGLAVSRDEAILASGSRDNTTRIWDMESGRLLQTLAGHTNSVFSVDISLDVSLVASGSADRTVRIWNLRDGSCRLKLTGHAGCVQRVAFSPNGRTIVSGSDMGEVRIWDLRDGTLMHELEHSGSIWTIEFSRDGERLAIGSDQATAIWSLENDEFTTLGFHKYAGTDAAFCYNDRAIVSKGNDTIAVREVTTGQLIRSYPDPGQFAFGLAVAEDSSLIASSRSDGVIRLLEVGKNFRGGDLIGHHQPALALAFGTEFRRLYSASADRTIKVWNPLSAVASRQATDNTGRLFTAAVSGDLGAVMTVSDDMTARLWSVDCQECVKTIRLDSPPRSAALSFDGEAGAIGCEDGSIRLFKAADAELRQLLSAHSMAVTCLDFISDTRLVSGAKDKRVCIWDCRAGSLIKKLPELDAEVLDVAYEGTRVGARTNTKTYLFDGLIWEWLATYHLQSLRSQEFWESVRANLAKYRLALQVKGTRVVRRKGDPRIAPDLAIPLELDWLFGPLKLNRFVGFDGSGAVYWFALEERTPGTQ